MAVLLNISLLVQDNDNESFQAETLINVMYSY